MADATLIRATTDLLADEIDELDRLIDLAHLRRARLVTAMRVRDRHHRNQTTIQQAIEKE